MRSGIPPTWSICIINEVPERGRPDTMTIMYPPMEYVPRLALLRPAHTHIGQSLALHAIIPARERQRAALLPWSTEPLCPACHFCTIPRAEGRDIPQQQRITGSMYQELFQFAPGREGYYGPFGGAFIPEILHETIDELQAAFAAAQADPTFWDEYVRLMASYS